MGLFSHHRRPYCLSAAAAGSPAAATSGVYAAGVRRLSICPFALKKIYFTDYSKEMNQENIQDEDDIEALGAFFRHVGQTVEATKDKYLWVPKP